MIPCKRCERGDVPDKWGANVCDECWDDMSTQCWTEDEIVAMYPPAVDSEEPPEPDGEAFRGGEAAAFEREQMDAARRLK